MAIPDLDEREIIGAKAPVGHDLDQTAFPDEPRLDDWRKLSDPGPGGQSWRQAGVVVHRNVRLEGQSFLVRPILVNEGPAILGPPVGESQQPMVEKVARSSEVTAATAAQL